jgi:hypothetical protein
MGGALRSERLKNSFTKKSVESERLKKSSTNNLILNEFVTKK